MVRGRNGFNDKPELQAFLGALRSISAGRIERKLANGTNCEEDGDNLAIEACQSVPKLARKNPVASSEQLTCAAQSGAKESSAATPAGDIIEVQEVIPYIGGWLLRKLLAFHCDSCKLLLMTNESAARIFEHRAFADAKFGLTQPTEECAAALGQMEQLFRQVMAAKSSPDGVLASIVRRFEQQGVNLPFCQEHSRDGNTRARRLFVRTRLHHWCRQRMRAIRKERDCVAAKRKLSKLQ